MGKVFINDLTVRGIIGINASEREEPQDIVINLDLFTDLKRAGSTDDIADCVDYQSVVEKVTAHTVSARRYTVEALAADIARIGLAEPGVERVVVRVEKPGAVRSCRSVGVEIERRPRPLIGGSTGNTCLRGVKQALARRRIVNKGGATRLMSTELPDRSKAMDSVEHSACLGLGSNSTPGRHLRRAIRRLRRGVAVDAVSTAWESPAVGCDGPDYVNAAVLVRTTMSRERLADWLEALEDELGRVRNAGQPARLKIDIDIVVYDAEVIEDDLWSQAYRAVPVAELLPDLSCPATGESLSHAATRLAAALPIKPRPDILAGPPGAVTSRTGTTDSTRNGTT